MTTTKRTDELQVGDVIVHPEVNDRNYLLPITTEHPGHLLAVTHVGPHMLTAGPHAGTQATQGRGTKGAPLWRITVDCRDNRWDGNPVSPADTEWTIA